MLRKRVAKKIVHGDGIGKKYLAHNDPRKKSLLAVNHPPPPPSKVKWSASYGNLYRFLEPFR